jgi:hypothetical protein
LVNVNVSIHHYHVTHIQVGSHRCQSEILRCPRVVPINLNYGQEAIGVGRDVNVGGWVQVANESTQKGLTGENVSEVDVFE